MVEQTITAKRQLASWQDHTQEQTFGDGSPKSGSSAAPWPFDKLCGSHKKCRRNRSCTGASQQYCNIRTNGARQLELQWGSYHHAQLSTGLLGNLVSDQGTYCISGNRFLQVKSHTRPYGWIGGQREKKTEANHIPWRHSISIAPCSPN